MRKIVIRLAVGFLLILIALTPLGPAAGRPPQLPAACQELAFSTEEDFVWGEIVVSDGDLLTVYEDASGSTQCQICATNAELVQETFDFDNPYDLGLDAADVVDAETYLVAFSTELNAPDPRRFTHGDLLATNGVVIPNQSLTYRFQVGYDLGLDGLHFVGDPGDIIAFLSTATQFSREDWLATPDLLVSWLEEYGIDIWFSTEGTWSPAGAPGFLDGDLLAVVSGSIVATNALLLDPSVPADVRDDGVDFGLDAATSTRTLERGYIHFSTEILFDGEVSFTDGDVLLFGNGVVVPHGDLIGCFKPAADFLGLDALHMAVEVPEGEIHGQKFHDLNGNAVADDGEPGLGQWEIHLDSVNGLDGVVNEVAFTDASGAYAFTVPVGTYRVSEVCPVGAAWHQSLPTPSGGVCGSGDYTLTLEAGEPAHTGIDFGNYQYATKSGFKFHDLKPDGVWDQANEPPLVEWRILLNGADGMNNPVSEEAWTDQEGFYSFSVPPGGYTVSEVCYDGWAQTLPLPDPPGVCGSGVYDIVLVSAEIRENNNFGNYEPIDLYLPIIVKDDL
jgi:hypothetical protein